MPIRAHEPVEQTEIRCRSGREDSAQPKGAGGNVKEPQMPWELGIAAVVSLGSKWSLAASVSLGRQNEEYEDTGAEPLRRRLAMRCAGRMAYR